MLQCYVACVWNIIILKKVSAFQISKYGDSNFCLLTLKTFHLFLHNYISLALGYAREITWHFLLLRFHDNFSLSLYTGISIILPFLINATKFIQVWLKVEVVERVV